MPRHWKKFMDKELLGAHDLDGRDVTVVIVDVDGGEISNGNKKNKKPIAKLASEKGRPLDKKLALNATNCRVLEQLAGSPDVDKWRGMSIVLFATTTQFGGQTVDCIRIRPYPPKNSTGRSGNGRGGRDRGDEQRAAPPADQPAAEPLPPDVAAMAAQDDDVPSATDGGADA